MLLAYIGKAHSEQELAQLFGAVPFLGTLPDNVVTGLEKLGYHALWFENATIEQLIDLLAKNLPIIVFMRASDLPHGRVGLHAIVVIGIESNQVIGLDPMLDDALRFELSQFLHAWAGLGHQGIVVWN
jgi:predicted double-glycine peptidase